MQYRRHSNNFSSLKTSKVSIILKWRLNLLLNLFTLVSGARDKLINNAFLNLLDG
jgi:hypothetical protein